MNLLDVLADVQKNLGKDVNDVEKSLQDAKAKQAQLTNDTVNTETTGWGADLVPSGNLMSEIMQIPGNVPSFIKALPGFHGYGMGISEKLPIVGKLPRAKANSEWLSGAGLLAEGKKRPATSTVTITQEPFVLQVDISDRFKTYSIDDMMGKISNMIKESVFADAEYVVLNADDTNTATGNINCNDAVPSATFADGANEMTLQFEDSIRKHILDNSYTQNIGDMEWADFISVRQGLGRYATKLNDMMLLMDSIAYHKALTLNEFKKANENGRNSTISDGAISNISGVDLFLPESFPATESDGTVSSTASNNTKGGFIYLYKPAVQFGFGKDLELEVVKIPGKGYSIIGTYEFGFGLVDKKSGETDPRMYAGINVTGLSVVSGS